MRLLRNALGGALGIVWLLAGPITYIICVVDTWHSKSSVLVKILVSLTADALAAAVWPGTWLVWLAMEAFGKHTPIFRVLGFW